MTLRLKVNLIVGALTLLFLAAVLGLQWRNMRDSVREEIAASNRVAAQLLNRTAWLYASQGSRGMLGFLQGAGRIRANDVVLFDKDGAELYRSPPSPYKAGRDAPGWFAALVSPPPSVQAFDFPDGRLEVHADASRSVVDAWDDALLLLEVSAGMLVLVMLGVFRLVGRTVRPFGQIVGALEEVQRGRFDIALPPLPGREAGAIGAAFNRMVGELAQHIETERRAVRAETQLSDSRELSRWIEHHIEQERLNIARELHDELGQSVTAMRSMATAIAQRCAGRDAQAEQAARLVAQESLRLYDAMHGIIPRLTPLVLDNFGLADAVADLAERTRRSHEGVRIDTDLDLGSARLPADAALALYRAAQEGITNALRHGEARCIELKLHGAAGTVELVLSDDGRGLPDDDAPRDGHYGLRWLRQRVEALRGSVTLENTAPHGARLAVRVPVDAQAA